MQKTFIGDARSSNSPFYGVPPQSGLSTLSAPTIASDFARGTLQAQSTTIAAVAYDDAIHEDQVRDKPTPGPLTSFEDTTTLDVVTAVDAVDRGKLEMDAASTS